MSIWKNEIFVNGGKISFKRRRTGKRKWRLIFSYAWEKSSGRFVLIRPKFCSYESGTDNLQWGNISSPPLCCFFVAETYRSDKNWFTSEKFSKKWVFSKGSKFPHFHFFPENPKNILHYFRMSLFHIPGETFDKRAINIHIPRYKIMSVKVEDDLKQHLMESVPGSISSITMGWLNVDFMHVNILNTTWRRNKKM